MVDAFEQSSSGLSDKAGFSDRLKGLVLDNPIGVASPAMIILSIEDEDARKVAVAVLREHGFGPTEAWLDGEQVQDRALYINFLGLCLFVDGAPLHGGSSSGLGPAPVAAWLRTAGNGW